MKAKDTEMSLEELVEIKKAHVQETLETRPDIAEYVFAVRRRQAEISFQKGRIQGQKDTWDTAVKVAGDVGKQEGVDEEAKRGIERCAMTYDDGKKAGKQEGIKEVVEWLQHFRLKGQHTLCVDTDILEGKLKEWRIE